jgi:aerobic carbon-monoxide dehydrogenase medium subunit
MYYPVLPLLDALTRSLMKAAPFAYHRPATIREATRLLSELAPSDGRILAGGQSLVPTMAFRMARPGHLIDINDIAELHGMNVQNGVLRVRACVRHYEFERPGVPAPTGALLRKMARFIAHYPIRQRGTFCGSVANADPASEWCCATVSLDGIIIAESSRGRRRIAAADFYKAVMTTDLAEDELITEVELPLLPCDTRAGFCEFSRRPGDFAVAMALVTYRLESARIREACVGLGGVEAVPRRIRQAEAALNGNEARPVTFEAAAETAANVVQPLEDVNNTAQFRRSLVRTLVFRALESAA